MSRPDSLPCFLIRVYDLYLSGKFFYRLRGKAFYHDYSQFENPTSEEIKFNNSEIITWECVCFPFRLSASLDFHWYVFGLVFEWVLFRNSSSWGIASLACKMIMSHKFYKQDASFFHPVWLNNNLVFLFNKKKGDSPLQNNACFLCIPYNMIGKLCSSRFR